MERSIGIAREIARTVLPIVALLAYSVAAAQCSALEQAGESGPFARWQGELLSPTPSVGCPLDDSA